MPRYCSHPYRFWAVFLLATAVGPAQAGVFVKTCSTFLHLLIHPFGQKRTVSERPPPIALPVELHDRWNESSDSQIVTQAKNAGQMSYRTHPKWSAGYFRYVEKYYHQWEKNRPAPLREAIKEMYFSMIELRRELLEVGRSRNPRGSVFTKRLGRILDNVQGLVDGHRGAVSDDPAFPRFSAQFARLMASIIGLEYQYGESSKIEHFRDYDDLNSARPPAAYLRAQEELLHLVQTMRYLRFPRSTARSIFEAANVYLNASPIDEREFDRIYR